MASIHKQPGKPHWFAAFTDHHGIRHFKSTQTPSRKEAQKIADAWEKATDLAATQSLTPDRARKLVEATVNDIMESSGSGLPNRAIENFFRQAAELVSKGQLTKDRVRPHVEGIIREIAESAGQPMPTASIRDWCNRWLEGKEPETEPSTYSRYDLAIRDFLKFLGNADRDLSTLTVDTIQRYRTDCSRRLSVGSTNTNLKVLRACLNSAYKQTIIERNVAAQVPMLQERGERKRRALLLDEIRNILKVCGDSPWRGLVLTGLYTGQRLGDCARVTWEQVDLLGRKIWFKTQKTGRRIEMHLAQPLEDYLNALPSVDNPREPVFPRFAEMARRSISSLSNAFAMEVLIPAKLMLPRPEDKKKSKTGTGRAGKRMVNEVTFHSLRHSLVTMLKATGASNALAQMIVGHDSTAVSQRYTHLAAADTVDAINHLPDVTKA